MQTFECVVLINCTLYMICCICLKSYPGLEQYAIKKFAEAFEVIPKTLAENSGHKVGNEFFFHK